MVDERGRERARYVMLRLLERAREKQVGVPALRSTDYINTIPPEREPWFPGDEEMERQVRRLIRWNAAVMVSSANRKGLEVGGHIATLQPRPPASTRSATTTSSAARTTRAAATSSTSRATRSPGIYARAYLMKRLTAQQLGRFRQEVQHGPGQGLSSYPHPRLMPDFWEFPTVSMGLGAINAIYQARFNRYLQNRGIKDTCQQHVWAFLGDGEMGEPESLGAIGLAAREELDNLTFVINCNLQQLDGPVRGNGKIIQELESFFRGAGWNVIKVVWGREWDPLLARDVDGVLVNRMNRTPDGQFQTYSVESGAYIREHFFGVDARLRKMVEHLTDERDRAAAARRSRLPQGVRRVPGRRQPRRPADGDPGPHREGLDDRGAGGQERHPPDEEAQRRHAQGLPRPARAADLRPGHRRALRPPTAPRRSTTRARTATCSPTCASAGARSAAACRCGACSRGRSPCPARRCTTSCGPGSGKQAIATTMALVRLLKDLMKDPSIGERIVPIAPDEYRTFGMDSMFSTAKIYNPAGQTYESVDRQLLLSYKESAQGQMLHEGISEAGCVASATAAGSSYSTHGEPMIPFYIFYSMFGFQRTGDSIWAMADQLARGFLIGATAGRTTLTGEGLQHADGHSPLLALTNPAVVHYDPAFAYEVAHIVRHGLDRMYGSSEQHPHGEDVIYYLTVYNEPMVQPAEPDHIDLEGLLGGIHHVATPLEGLPAEAPRVQLLASGVGYPWILKAQQLLATDWGVGADLWSVTSWNELSREALATEEWNLLNPTEEARVPFVTRKLGNAPGPVVAVSDYMKAVQQQISAWVPQRFHALGADGFGFADTRPAARRFFKIDAESVVVQALAALAEEGAIARDQVQKAIDVYRITDPTAVRGVKQEGGDA